MVERGSTGARRAPRAWPRASLAVVAWAAAFLVVTASVGMPGTPASATTLCLTDKIKYTNKGGYIVERIEFKWINPNTTKVQDETIDLTNSVQQDSSGALTTGKSWTFDIAEDAKNMNIDDGAEVWLSIHIVYGDNTSCRKDEHKLIWSTPNGVKMNFYSAGTTLNDNNCKYDGNMSKSCHSGE